VLAHVLEGSGAEAGPGTEAPDLEAWRERLEQQATELRGLGAEVRTELLTGIPDEVLAERAEKLEARLIVLAALGRRAGSWWKLGGTAEKLTQASGVPVLVARNAEPVLRWLAGERPLRVLLGHDFSAAAAAAKEWVGQLRRIAACDVLVAYVYWPPEQFGRLGLRTPMDLVRSQPQVEEMLLRDLREAIGDLPGEGPVRYRVLFSFGRPADPLLDLAEQDGADLVVVGNHQRKGFRRLWHGSVSHGVLHLSTRSVACVPAPASTDPARQPLPEIQDVLVPTDFSPLANRAIPYAYALLPPGGRVHLVHVVEPEEQSRPTRSDLMSLVPEAAARRGVLTEAVVVEGRDVARTLCQTAERVGAAVICMASHGRSGLLKALLGSVAQEVVRSTCRPVLLVPPTQAD
jgi:nucleotide-binding universal stress UspA family protein